MEFQTTAERDALREVLNMSLDSIFDGYSLDSMSTTGEIEIAYRKCKRFTQVLETFMRNMEPTGIVPDDVIRVNERFEWCRTQLGAGY